MSTARISRAHPNSYYRHAPIREFDWHAAAEGALRRVSEVVPDEHAYEQFLATIPDGAGDVKIYSMCWDEIAFWGRMVDECTCTPSDRDGAPVCRACLRQLRKMERENVNQF